MPSIGSLDFSFTDGLDSGVALLLTKPPTEAVRGTYRGCQLIAAPDSPHVVCRFSGATNESDAVAIGVERAQEALDVLSVLGRGDLVTRDTEEEHLTWWSNGPKRSLMIVSTATLSISVGPIEITVKDAQGNVVPPVQVTPTHHIGFRFYRLAQASDDLYDAFRNMYLAFESLLSTKCPKGKEMEIDWLRASLGAVTVDLNLASLMPSHVPDPVTHVVDTVYRGARLPLFHAKDGRAYFAPSRGPSDRLAVETALSLLTKIVLRMADVWHSARRRSSWVNLELFEQNNRSMFDCANFVFSDDPKADLKRELDSAELTAGVSFPAGFSEHHRGAVRHNLAGQLDTALISSRGRLHTVYVAKDGKPLIGFNPDTTVDCSGFHELGVRLFLRSRNAGQPRYIYPR